MTPEQSSSNDPAPTNEIAQREELSSPVSTTTDRGNGDSISQEPQKQIYVVDNATPAVLRSRFYKGAILFFASICQVIASGEVINTFGPEIFFVFLVSTVICGAIAAHEIGSFLAAIDMRGEAFKKVLLESWIDSPEKSDRTSEGKTDL